MPTWAKIVLRTIGVVNAAAALLGTYFLVPLVIPVLTERSWAIENADAPYFRFAFAVMTVVNLAFLGVLLLTAIWFIKAKLSAVNLYSLTVLLLCVYFVAIRMLWRSSEAVSLSVAAATGIGNMGVAPFLLLFVVPVLYPLVSMVLVQLLKQRYGTPRTPISALC